MAREIDLPQGQIQPTARPVDAFIRPSDINVSQPNQLAQLGQPKGVSTIGTGATPDSRGRNNYAQLAEALEPFNKNLTQVLQTAGLMYAQGQIAEGEKQARNQVLQAMAQNDSAMESEELQRAAMNRSLAAKDPQAGGFMAMLNPYQQIGWERGKSKMAGLEAARGLPAFIAQNNSKIDYTAPDQGFAALAQLQAQYTAQLARKYGVDASSPGFQRYTLPEIEKAQERVQTQHVADRKKYFDTAAVGQAATLLSQLYAATKAGRVEFNGATYNRAENQQSFYRARQLRAEQIVQQIVLSASLPGEATERTRDIFKALSATADYLNDPEFKSFVESIPGTEPARGADGKVIVSPDTGQPMRLTWGDMYGLESIKSEIEYGQAGYTRRKREREEAIERADGFDDGLIRLLGQYPPGPEQKAAADAYVSQWHERNGRALGVSYAELQKRRESLVDLDAKRYAEMTNPEAAPTFWTELEADRGQFDPAQWRKRVMETASQIYDPREKAAFIKQATERIGQRELEQATFKGYDSTRDKVITSNVSSRIAQHYRDPASGDAKESMTRQRGAFTAAANAALLAKEKQLGRKLTNSEVSAVTQEAINGYGKGAGATGSSGQSVLDYLFPGSRRTDEPSVENKGVLNYGKAPKTYGVSELDSIDARQKVLPNYRRNPVLSVDATLELLNLAAQGKPWPKAFDRAWRDARAKNAGEFLLFHADYYGKTIGLEVPPELRQQINLKTSAQANASNAAVTRAATQGSTPWLAQLGDIAMNVLTGSAPAAAAPLPAAGNRIIPLARITGRPNRQPPGPQGGGGPTPGGGGGGVRTGGRPPNPAPAPAAPALPSPAAVAVKPYQGSSSSGQRVAMRTAAPELPAITLEGPGPSALRRMQRPRVVPIDIAPIQGGGGRFEKPVSVVYENSSGQPGVDLYFPSKRFPAVLGGVVKDVSFQGGPGFGYGNYVVVESIDPLSGQKVDVLYGHLADGVNVRPGQRIEAGQIIGKQGGTGRVVSQDGTIASIDFLAPRPPGSKDMTPYSGFDRLRRHVVAVLQRGGDSRPSTRPGGGLTGLATYYNGSGGSDGVAGGPTANGEIYDPSKLTAAVQWSLRGKYLNKWVTVEDIDTGKTVKVWVNDVGQMGGSRLDINRSDPRVIDLSPAAFRKLFGSTQRGVGRVRILPI